MHPAAPCSWQHGRAYCQAAASRRLVYAQALPFRVPDASQLSRKLNPLQLLPLPQQVKDSRPQLDQQANVPQQRTTDAGPTRTNRSIHFSEWQPAAAPAPGVPASSSSTVSAVKFAKHLANVSNGCAPPPSRFESLGWLLFETKRLQASVIGAEAQLPDSWLSSADGMQLLEQVYLVGSAIAELGTADGLQPLSTSNGSRAIVSLDYSRLLERFLQQHGQLLTEAFWSGLHAYDDLQAKAIHVATALETRCMVHAMLFDKLIERVGTETSIGMPWGGSSWQGHSSSNGPLATAITNTMINTTQQHSAPVTSQSTVAAPSAVNSNTSSNSNTATTQSTTSSSGVLGFWGWMGQLGAVFLLVVTAAGKVVQVVMAVVSFAKDLVLQLLMLNAVAAGAKAVAAKAGSKAQLQPALAVAGAAALSPAGAYQLQQLQPSAGSPASRQPLPVAVAAATPAVAAAAAAAPQTALSAGSLGLLGAVPLSSSTGQPSSQPESRQQQQQPPSAVSTAVQQSPSQPEQQQQQQQQWRVEAPAAHSTAAWPPTAAPQQPQHVRHPSKAPALQQARRLPQQLLRTGLSSAQQLLHKAAGKVSAAAAAVQQSLQGMKPFRAGSEHLLYSLWSPAEAGLQEFEAEGHAVQFADAGWGIDSSSVGLAERSVEQGGW